MRLKLLVLLVLCGVGVQACGDDEAAAPPSRSGRDGGGGSGPPPVISDRDSGGGEDEEDGGEDTASDSGRDFDAGGPSSCEDFEAIPPETDPDPDMNYNMINEPTDFAITRASAAWAVRDCNDPTLVVTLSSGNCPDGDGHQIAFFVPAEGIEDRKVVLGNNPITEDSPGEISVRYTRPRRLTPNGQWGTCKSASGTLDLIRNIDLISGRKLEGDFLLELTRCDDGAPSIQTVEGQFNVEIPATIDDLCP
jgi:hypothetical protein